MGSAFQILSTIDSKYGIYYTYGNHDKNNYAITPNYTADQLAETIKENSIQILEDDTTVINDEIALIGRADRGDGSADRQAISDLTSELNENQEWIVLDHQSSDYENVQKAGCDLILSGHIKHCVRDGIEHGDADKTIEQFTKAVERFANMK